MRTPLAIDDNVNTKFLHFKGETQPTGFQVSPTIGAYDRHWTDPHDRQRRTGAGPGGLRVVRLERGDRRALHADRSRGDRRLCRAGQLAPLTKNTTPIVFPNKEAYAHYQLLFTSVRDAANANSMQIAEVELLGTLAGVSPPGGNPDGPNTTIWRRLRRDRRVRSRQGNLDIDHRGRENGVSGLDRDPKPRGCSRESLAAGI